MPYFIFQVHEFPVRQLKRVDQYEDYKTASARVKQLRSELAEGTPRLFKMIHAESELHAEDLLNQVREPKPELGDD